MSAHAFMQERPWFPEPLVEQTSKQLKAISHDSWCPSALEQHNLEHIFNQEQDKQKDEKILGHKFIKSGLK